MTGDDAELLLRVPTIRGGPEVLAELSGALDEAATGMRERSTLCSSRASPSG